MNFALTDPMAVSKSHPDRQVLERLLLDEPRASEKALVRHVAADCPVCWEAIGSLWRHDRDRLTPPGNGHVSPGRCSGPGEEEPYDRAMRRAIRTLPWHQQQVAGERAAAGKSVDRLLHEPYERQLMLVRNSRRFHTWSVCERLLDESWARRFDDLAACEQLARLALLAANSLEASAYGDQLVADFRAHCWAAVANALRLRSDLSGAEQALGKSEALIRSGTGDPLEVAWVRIVASSLHRRRKRYDLALRSANEALVIYRDIGHLHELGQTLIQKGIVYMFLERRELEVLTTRAGLDLVDPVRDPRVAVAGWHNLILSLHHNGQDRQALAMLARARPIYLELGDRMALLRFQWAEGKVAAKLARGEQAEGCLRQARQGFIDQGVTLDAALISLDLAAVLSEQGRYSEVCHLAAEMIALFESVEAEQEALAALILFRQAAERERVTRGLLERVAATLRKSQGRG